MSVGGDTNIGSPTEVWPEVGGGGRKWGQVRDPQLASVTGAQRAMRTHCWGHNEDCGGRTAGGGSGRPAGVLLPEEEDQGIRQREQGWGHPPGNVEGLRRGILTAAQGPDLIPRPWEATFSLEAKK